MTTQNLQNTNEVILASTSIEKSLLAQIIGDNKIMTETLAILKSDDFMDKKHQIIFQAMTELHKEEAVIKSDTIYQRLGQADRNIVSYTDVNSIGFELDGDKFKYNVKVIKDLSNRRASLKQLEKSMKDLYDLKKPYSETVNSAINYMVSKEETNEGKDFIDVYRKAKDRMYEFIATGKEVKGMECGIRDLDVAIGGFERKKLHIVGAEPRKGKTTLTVATIKGLAKNYKTYFFSMEQEDVEAMYKSMSSDTGIFNDKINTPTKLSKEELKKIDELEEKYSKLNLRINDKSTLTIAQLRSIVMREKQTRGIDVVAIDYLGIMTRESQKGESTSVALGKITRGLQHLAKDFDVAVVLLCQLNRLEEGKRPILQNLRDSGEIEACGDKIMLLYSQEEQPDILEVIVAKNKGGKEGTVRLEFDKSLQRITSSILDDDELTSAEKYLREQRKLKIKEKEIEHKKIEDEESPIPDLDVIEFNKQIDAEIIPDELLLKLAEENFNIDEIDD